MGVVTYLRAQLEACRDAYDATIAKRMKLYVYLKANSTWQSSHVRTKLGAKNHDWLVGLVAYGDSHGWLVQQAAKQRKGV